MIHGVSRVSRQADGVVQRRGLRDAYPLVVDAEPGRLPERERAAAATRADDDGLPWRELTLHGFAERLGAVRRTHDEDEPGAVERRVDVVPRAGDFGETRDVAFCVNTAVRGNRGYVLRKLRKIEQANFVPVRCEIECRGRAARSRAEDCNDH